MLTCNYAMRNNQKTRSGVPQFASFRRGCRHVYIYIYTHAVGSITWPHFGHFQVNNLATSRSMTWPPFFEPMKIGGLGVFSVHSFQGWCKISVLKVVFGQKRGFPKKKVVHLFWGGGFQGLVDCCCMMLLDALEGCSKNPYKNRVFLSTLLLDAEETEKQEETKNAKQITTIFWGALKTGRK